MAWITPPTKAVGDVLYAADINALSGDVTLLAHPPLVAVYKSSTQSIPDSTGTNLVCDQVLVSQDPTGLAMYSTGTGLVTIRTAGIYSAEGQIQYKDNGSSVGVAQAVIRLNGGTNVVTSSADGQAVVESVPVVMEPQRFNVGDTLNLRAFQSSGSSRTQDNQGQGTFLSVRFEGL